MVSAMAETLLEETLEGICRKMQCWSGWMQQQLNLDDLGSGDELLALMATAVLMKCLRTGARIVCPLLLYLAVHPRSRLQARFIVTIGTLSPAKAGRIVGQVFPT